MICSSSFYAASLLSVLLAATGCQASPAGSAGAGQAGPILRTTLHGYSNNQRFELVSEGHTDRVAYYSRKRTDAARKIQDDEVMHALLDHLDELGFDRHASDGRAPSRSSNGVLSWGLEIERDGRAQHWLIGKGTDAQEQMAFRECMTTFLALYNVSAGFQTVVNPDGAKFFEDSKRRLGTKRGTGR